MLPVSLRQLSKHFGATIAVDRIDLDIAAGELFFLLGPSGCGKTTLLRMLAGFTEPTAGQIRFGPRDVTLLPPNRRNTGMCFQSYALWPHLTVAQNVAFGLEVRKIDPASRRQRVAEALDLVQMSAYAQRKPNELSGGQQQRVALARALVIQPDVLLLDEPLSNLDAKLRVEMRTQIRAICKQARITAVYVTHDQKEALAMADRMAVLERGKLVQAGAPAELYHRPRNRFVADFLGETNFIPAVVAAVEADHVLLQSASGRLRAGVFPPGLRVGQSVLCCIRPEAARLETSPPEPPELPEVPQAPAVVVNLIPARVRGRIYLGEIAQHQLCLSGDIPFKVFELNPRGQPAENLHVRFAPEDVVVLADAPGAPA